MSGEAPAPVAHPRLTDGVVTLRGWEEEDVPALVAVCQDPEIARWTRVPSPYGESQAREFLATKERMAADHGDRYFAVVDARDRRLLGSTGLQRVRDRRAQIGYLVAAEARGRGVATRAVRLLAAWAFAEEDVARLDLLTQPENIASQRVAERAGFRREAVLRSYIELNGRRHDAVVFSLLPTDDAAPTLP